jgi:hypothetical protein
MNLIKKVVIVMVAISFIIVACPGFKGQTEDGDSYPSGTSVLLNFNHGKIELDRIQADQGNDVHGIWRTENTEQNVYSKISFRQNGIFQEKVYSLITNDRLAVLDGTYFLNENELIIELNTQFHFSYQFNGNQLELQKLN